MSKAPEITHAQDEAWRSRELDRFTDGVYKRVIWAKEGWFVGTEASYNHYLHVSNDNPEQVAFTPDAHKGVADRQTRMSPGRYLTRYFLDVLGTTGVQTWAERYAEATSDAEVHFATTPDDIVEVYAHGPRSCMTESDSVRVYGAGDLAIAFLGSRDHATARAVCWPAKLLHSRIYGDESRLRPALEKLGYDSSTRSSHPFEGARLLCIEAHGGYVAPYWDGEAGASLQTIDDVEYLVLTRDGEFNLKSQTGIIGGNPCVNCWDYVDDDDYTIYAEDTWCNGCANEYLCFCENCEDTVSRDDTACVVDGRGHAHSWCEYCRENNTTQCGTCNIFFVGPLTEVDDVSLCATCYERDASVCDHCDNATLGELTRVEDGSTYGEGWCDACVENNAGTCAECAYGRDIYPKENITASNRICRCDDCHAAWEAEQLEDENLPPVYLLPQYAASLQRRA